MKILQILIVLVNTAYCIAFLHLQSKFRYSVGAIASSDLNRDYVPVSNKDHSLITTKKNVYSALLISSSIFAGIFNPTRANAKGPQYLTEPTEEFKDEEARVAAFQAEQQRIRKEWDRIVDRLATSDDPKVTAQLLRDLKSFLVNIQDMPVGVKKRDLVKLCRGKKFNGRKIKPNWTKEVESEYEILIQEINRRLVPVNAVSLYLLTCIYCCDKLLI